MHGVHGPQLASSAALVSTMPMGGTVKRFHLTSTHIIHFANSDGTPGFLPSLTCLKLPLLEAASESWETPPATTQLHAS